MKLISKCNRDVDCYKVVIRMTVIITKPDIDTMSNVLKFLYYILIYIFINYISNSFARLLVVIKIIKSIIRLLGR